LSSNGSEVRAKSPLFLKGAKTGQNTLLFLPWEFYDEKTFHCQNPEKG
jgi:hypothetical protein